VFTKIILAGYLFFMGADVIESVVLHPLGRSLF